MNQDDVKKLVDTYDWEGIAKAWRDANVTWHAKEWEEFVTAIKREAVEQALDHLYDEAVMLQFYPEGAIVQPFLEKHKQAILAKYATKEKE